jgi:hypothetical protein
MRGMIPAKTLRRRRPKIQTLPPGADGDADKQNTL